MITPELTSISSEHWLTIMTCNVCENTPSSSPVYKCLMGHLICGNCYDNLKRKGKLIRCKKCVSCEFTKHQASKDFLNKLTVKPGIGRSRRYNQSEVETRLSNVFLLRDDVKENITVEKLFQMSTTQIKHLFRLTAKGKKSVKLTPANQQSCIFNHFERGDMGCAFDEDKIHFSEVVLPIALSISNHNMFEASLSKKPILCPHNRCKKIVTISSFAQHFKYDHRGIPVFNLEISKVLRVCHSAGDLEYGITTCIAVIHIQQFDDVTNFQRLPTETFWVMASGSSEEERLKAYVVYWILTDSTKQFHCTIDVSSYFENVSCSTFCGVTRVYDSCNPLNITNDLNCLFLTYPSMCNLLSEGSELNLRVSIY